MLAEAPTSALLTHVFGGCACRCSIARCGAKIGSASTTDPRQGAFSFSQPTLSLCLESHHGPACVWSLPAAIIIPTSVRLPSLPERMLFLRTYAYLAEPMLLEATILLNVCCFMAGTRLCAVTQNEHNAFWQGAHQCVARASSPSHPFPHCSSKSC